MTPAARLPAGPPDPLPGKCWRCWISGHDVAARENGASCQACGEAMERRATAIREERGAR